MEKYFSKLAQSGLFGGFSVNEISDMAACLGAKVAAYEKGRAIFMQGDEIPDVGIIIEGRVKIQKENVSGKTIMLDELGPGEIFGAGFCACDTAKMPVGVWAAVDTVVMFVEYNRIITTCRSACEFHRRLIRNMFLIMSDKLASKSKKISILKNTTTKEKLMAFFEMQSEKSNSPEFVVEFSRGELAEYIGSNRSAMSRELHSMRAEGLIEFNGKHFKMIRQV